MRLDPFDHATVRDELSPWCATVLGSSVERIRFEAGFTSAAFGVRLADGRDLVVKTRTPADRLAGCHALHEHLWQAGYPCAQPILGPTPLGVLTATVEVMAADRPVAYPSPERSARALRRLVALAPRPGSQPSVLPNPTWTDMRHNGSGRWPAPTPGELDMNATPDPAWLADIVDAVRAVVRAADLPDVLGHGDWEPHNMRWPGSAMPDPAVVFDWDSAAALPEAAIAGLAAICFARSDTGQCALVPESTAFLDAYQVARHRPFTPTEWRVAWAAGVWLLAHDAKAEYLLGREGVVTVQLRAEADARLTRTGVRH